MRHKSRRFYLLAIRTSFLVAVPSYRRLSPRSKRNRRQQISFRADRSRNTVATERPSSESGTEPTPVNVPWDPRRCLQDYFQLTMFRHLLSRQVSR